MSHVSQPRSPGPPLDLRTLLLIVAVFILALILLNLSVLRGAPSGQTSPGGGVPVGGIIVSLAASCPASFTEVVALDAKALSGTLAAHADVGTGGGADSLIPAGTNSTAGFTPAGTNSSSPFTPAGTNSTASFTPAGANATSTVTPLGTNNACATVKFTTSASGSAACSPAFTPTFTGSSSTVGAQTFTGTVGSVPAETFTGTAGTVPAQTFTGTAGTVPAETFSGTSFDNRSAFVRVLFCQKD